MKVQVSVIALCWLAAQLAWGDQVWTTTAPEEGKRLFAVAVDCSSGKVLHDVCVFTVERPEEIHALNSYASPTAISARPAPRRW